MSITISLSPDIEKKLQQRAAKNGQNVADYVYRLIERDVAESVPQTSMTLDEALAPIRREFEESGMTEEELDSLIEEARQEVWQEKQRNS